MSLSEREIAFSRVAVERGYAPRVPLQSRIGEYLARKRSGYEATFDDITSQPLLPSES